MSAEIIDYLLVFWAVLAIVVFILGNIYDKQLQDKKKRAQREKRRYSTAPDQRSSVGTNLDDVWSTAPDTRRHNSGVYQSAGVSASSWDRTDNSSCYQKQQQQHQAYSPTTVSGHYNDPLTGGSYMQSSGYGSGGSSTLGYHHQPALDQHYQQQVRDRSGSYQYGPNYNDMKHNYGHTEAMGAAGMAPPSATIPTATGFNSDCVEWVNGILYLFYTQPEKYGPIISENVYRSLNEKLSNLTSSSSEYSNLLIEFTGVNTHDSTRPELTNIRTESESDKSISASCKIYNRRINFSLTIRQVSSGVGGEQSRSATGSGQHHFGHYGVDDDQVKSYELILENLEGKLKSMAMLNEKLIVIQFIEKPDTKILLRPVPVATGSSSKLINEDSLVQLILQTITQVVVDLYFGDDADFPQYKHHSSTYSNYKQKLNSMIKVSASELKRQIKHDFFGALSSSGDHHHHKERKVFVKIIRATNINYNQNVTCLMELDTPRQQAVSSTKQGSDPYWDEHFLFNISDKSYELTLELWDSINPVALITADPRQPETPGSSLKRQSQQSSKSAAAGNSTKFGTKWHKGDLTAGAKFLGLARVSIDELRKNPVQKMNVALQPLGNSGPAATDLGDSSVGGELQLELLFMEHTAPTAAGQANLLGSPSPNQSAAEGLLRKSNSLSSLAYQQGDIVSIDRKLTPSGFVITTTTITKQPNVKQHAQSKQHQDQLLLARSQSPGGSTSMATEHSFDEMMMNFDGVSSCQMSAASGNQANTATGQHSDRRSEGTGADSSMGGRPLSRSRSRSRTLLRAIKKRFSFSRTRSRSVGESGAHEPGQQSPTSGADYEAHSRASSEISTGGIGEGGRAKSVPASRDPSEVPTIVINKGRLSDTANAFTFTHPKSQLVYEVEEPSLHDGSADGPRSSAIRYRYYAVSDEPAIQRKWRKRGLKMHVFNEHQFIACHLAGSSTCHLCGRVFSRRPGKQGYKCRNCHLLSHKQCHIKVDHNCPYAKRDGLKLEYIDADPPASLVDELMLNQSGGRITSPVSQAADLTHQQHHYQHQQPSSRQHELYQRSSQKTRAGRPTMRMGAKSISVEVDDR
uniref:Phorbol-ester/DAG-type domain-containing protein n=1 Tax=Aceria tosichella TaxID=561515 RepID=A0A6G1SL04_9ACAR